MKKLCLIRLPLQLLMMFLQTYFFIETVRLYLYGYVMYAGEPIESSWFSMLFTLLVVTGCELVAFVESILLLASKQGKRRFLYFVMVLINAMVFVTCAYYTTVGTIVCLVFYLLLYLFRIVHLISNLSCIFKKQTVYL